MRPCGGDVRRGVLAPDRLDAAVLVVDELKLSSGSSTTPLRKVVSLNEPVIVPSMLAPLSPQM